MGEAAVTIVAADFHLDRVDVPAKFIVEPMQMVVTIPNCTTEEEAGRGSGGRVGPVDEWLPVTESRGGSTVSAFFHLTCSGIGFQCLYLPVAFASLGWAWGSLVLSLVFAWHLYTGWLLVQLHESPTGIRYSRYLHLAIRSFGPKLGKLLGIFPVMYLSGGTCVILIITGGGALEQLFKIICGDGPTARCSGGALSGAEWFLVFTCIAIAIAQLPNLNSITAVSLLGALTAVTYCSVIWIFSARKGRADGASHEPLVVVAAESGWAKAGDVMNAIGIIALSFRGHNLVLEIQGTLPLRPKHPTKESMWRAVRLSYSVIALCLYPLAIAGFWAYGNKISKGGLLSALANSEGHYTSKFIKGAVYLLLVINSLSTFQIYAMPVFDNLEMRYTAIKKHRCSRLARTCLRLFFGCIAYFISVAFPFLGSLGPLIGGLASPLTFAYPCFMWVLIKKPRKGGGVWYLNLGLGCLGLVMCVLLVAAALWNLIDKGLKANFFKP